MNTAAKDFRSSRHVDLARLDAYKRNGDVNDVVFPCGQTIGADGDTINLYCGAAGWCVGPGQWAARADLAWLDANPKFGRWRYAMWNAAISMEGISK